MAKPYKVTYLPQKLCRRLNLDAEFNARLKSLTFQVMMSAPSHKRPAPVNSGRGVCDDIYSPACALWKCSDRPAIYSEQRMFKGKVGKRAILSLGRSHADGECNPRNNLQFTEVYRIAKPGAYEQ